VNWIKEQAKTPHFIKLEKSCCDELLHSKGVSTNLQTLLSLPLTSLRQYNAALEELQKFTYKNTYEHTVLLATLSKIQEVAILAASSVKEMENKHRVLAIQQCFSNYGKAPVLAVPNRVVLCEGKLIKLCRKDTKKRYFWLFNDILIYGKIKSPKQYKFHRQMPIPNSKFVDLPDDPTRQPYAFQIITSNKSFTVFALSEHEKKSWLAKHEVALDMINNRNSDQDKRISKLLAPVWLHDHMSNNCLICSSAFTVVKRRHHCRKCGRLVCGACSPKSMVLENLGKAKRVCNDCYEPPVPPLSPKEKARAMTLRKI
jgi:hypothetical protein